MIELEKAFELIIENTPENRTIEINIENAAGYISSEDLHSKLDMPPFNKSAMDGYAFKFSEGLNVYKNLGIIPAGIPFPDGVKEGECVSIMTGAPLPEGSDTVIMIEAAEKVGGSIHFRKEQKKGANVCYKGEDIKEGELIFEKGKMIRKSDIALLTASGYSKVKVFLKPSVAVLNTGSEIIEPGNVLKYGQIYNTNGIMLRTMASDTGIEADYMGIAADNEADLTEKISEGLKHDILLISGGVSMGEFDLVPKILEKLGVEKIFHKIRIKPGKPVFFGKTDSCTVFGLPGNPLSNFVGFELFVKSAVRKMTGEKELLPVYLTGEITQNFRHKGNRKNFYPAVIKNSSGRVTVTPVISNGSADIFSLSKANGFLIADINKKEYGPGEDVLYICF